MFLLFEFVFIGGCCLFMMLLIMGESKENLSLDYLKIWFEFCIFDDGVVVYEFDDDENRL